MGIGGIFKKKKVAEMGKLPELHKPLPHLQSRPVVGSFGKVQQPTSMFLTERVKRLSKQGMAEPEIVRSLRTEGYSSLDIDRAIRDSLKTGVGEPELPIRERPVREFKPLPLDEDVGDLKMPEPPIPQRPGIPKVPIRTEPPRKPFPVLGFGKPAAAGGNREVQELIEITVEEKWKEAEKRIKGIEDKFADFEGRLNGLEGGIEEVKKEEQKKEMEISAKIDTYKDSMGEITTKMEGMESALKGALESVLDSNRTLAEAVRGLKERNR